MQSTHTHIHSYSQPSQSEPQSYHEQPTTVDNTLGSLTKKFVKLIKEAPNQKIQIQEASQMLEIQKRRIYDITNVLEGIGYIQKLGKNVMQWVGGIEGSELQDQVVLLDQKIEELAMKTIRIQEEIDVIKSELINQLVKNSQFNYITYDDLTQIMKAFDVPNLLVYSGAIGDQLQNDSNPQTNISQCTIESSSRTTKIDFINRDVPPQQVSFNETAQVGEDEYGQQKTEFVKMDGFPEDVFDCDDWLSDNEDGFGGVHEKLEQNGQDK